jgi:hypothetical protein
MGDTPSPPKRRPGRPALAPEDRRTISTTTYLTVREFDALCADARRNDVSLATHLRACLLRAFDR